MLQKLRSRYPIDLPAEGWGRAKGLATVLTGLFVLFVLLPLLLSPLAALLSRDLGARSVVLAVGAGFGTLLLVLVLGAIRGKPGHDR